MWNVDQCSKTDASRGRKGGSEYMWGIGRDCKMMRWRKGLDMILYDRVMRGGYGYWMLSTDCWGCIMPLDMEVRGMAQELEN